jgi:uncharacterized protein
VRPFVSLITLGVADVERAKRFYVDGLGWPIAREVDDWICFELGDGSAALSLWPRDRLAEDARAGADKGGFDGVTLAYNVPSRERVDELLSQAERAGGRIVKEGQDAFWGGYSGYFADPDGHLWEVTDADQFRAE